MPDLRDVCLHELRRRHPGAGPRDLDRTEVDTGDRAARGGEVATDRHAVAAAEVQHRRAGVNRDRSAAIQPA